MDELDDYYALLGVSPQAPRDEIVARIRVLLKQWHPDVCRRPDAHEMTKRILRARALLLDPASRSRYDRSVRGGDARRSAEWQAEAQRAEEQAEAAASLDLDELISQLLRVVATGAAVVAQISAEARPDVERAAIAGASMSRSDEGRNARGVIGAIVGFVVGLPAGGVGALPGAAIGWFVGYFLPEIGVTVAALAAGLAVTFSVLCCGLVAYIGPPEPTRGANAAPRAADGPSVACDVDRDGLPERFVLEPDGASGARIVVEGGSAGRTVVHRADPSPASSLSELVCVDRVVGPPFPAAKTPRGWQVGWQLRPDRQALAWIGWDGARYQLQP